MFGKTAGVVGTGKIGKAIIEILLGFGMKVIAYDVFPDRKYAEEYGKHHIVLGGLKTGKNLGSDAIIGRLFRENKAKYLLIIGIIVSAPGMARFPPPLLSIYYRYFRS